MTFIATESKSVGKRKKSVRIYERKLKKMVGE